MPHQPLEIRYASGEIARVGDRVDDNGQDAVVEEVHTESDDAEVVGEDGAPHPTVRQPGLSLLWDLGLPIFRPVTSKVWQGIKLKGRAGDE